MGKPAARMGDMTAHGGSIVMGLPTVLIGGMPAARVGDMHVCPMVTPGVPPIPHVGGPILPPGGIGVLIGGMPAARMGDMAVCVGPPSSIILGCMTVLIGEVGSGSGGGGGGGGAGAGGGSVSAANAALVSASIAGQSSETEETSVHFLDAVYIDKAKKPVGGLTYSVDLGKGRVSSGPLAGPIKKGGIDQGSYDITLRGITNVKWSKSSAKVGDTVDCEIETVGVTGKAIFTIFVRDGSYTDYELATLEASVSGDKTKVSWKFEVEEKYLTIADKKGTKKRYSQPFFFFKVAIDDLHEQSGMLYLEDYTEIVVKDADGNALKNRKYKTMLASGVVKEGTLDGSGKAKVEKVAPGKVNISVNLNT